MNKARMLLLAISVFTATPTSAQVTDNPPPLPDTGTTRVTVSTEAELQAAVRNLKSNTTIVIQPGTYQLTATLYVKGPLQNVSIRGGTIADVPYDFDRQARPMGAAYDIGADERRSHP